MKVKKILTLFIIIVLTLTTGCYDRVEIEQRAIIGAFSIELVDEVQESFEKADDAKQASSDSSFNENKNGPLKIIFGVINPSKLQSGDKAFKTVEVRGANIPDAVEKLGEKISRQPYFAQMRMLYISDKVLKNKKVFKEVLDRLDRSTKINETANIVVIKGETDNLAKVEPELENTIAAHIFGISENSKITANVSALPIYKFLSVIRNSDGCCFIPVVEIKNIKGKFEPSIDKVVLIKDYQFLRYLDTKYIKTFRILNNDFRSGRMLINYENISIPYYVYSTNKRIWLEEEEGKLKYKVKIEFEGDVEELEFGKDLFDTQTIDKINKAAEETIKEEFIETTKYFQDTIGYDYLGFKDFTHKYYNKIYQKYKDNWDEVFKNAQIEYDVKVYIRRIGISKK
ncbi:germination protein, Ger(x)C family [Caloramator quimbayensis]|uniref:Germination protein, Ger(X)C family n=1 Tax=Caloramator quimbayensis TaxID=1147123 RepID=A0A1T4WG17_9CLOT|nr:Ger(x)C family spore germination protein [Caloramator quimbayensis]SKA76252.1 germination protein, Ger(x)C family [Caloramator quimbayensis]